ncbi:MAG: S1C family serine protease [Faecousia sp.]
MNEQYDDYFETSSSPIPVCPPEPARQHREKNHIGLRVCALALVFSLLGGVLGSGSVIWYQNGHARTAAESENVTAMLQGIRETSVLDTVPVDTGKLMTAAEVYAANVNATVGITTSITTNYWGFQTTSAASGSGFILTEDGYILTNYHVIESSDSITVSLYNGDTYDAALIGYDESNDVAVLKVDAEGLSPVILGDSDNLNVGDSVVAIGNPLGELTFSLTAGLVSAKDREITLSSSVTMDLIQTDCAINSGNSGGALFNLYGEVIGITNAKYSSSASSSASIDNIGFAIPINNVLPIVESIIEKGYISKPYIGVTVSDVTQQTQLYGIPAGAAVQSVVEDSPAAQAGLQAGDVITRVNGTEITGSGELVSLVSTAEVGDELTMNVYRQGATAEITVTVGEQIQSALANEQAPQTAQQEMGRSQSGIPFGSRR